MGVPDPLIPLSDHCSIVHDGTLYVYSPGGFQSLELREGAKWKRMPMDVSLTGAECVKVVPGGDNKAAKLYVVGGSVNETAAGWDYPGLMHYSFSDKKWDWVRPKDFVTQNRRNHAATYLPKTNQLVVYSGSQTTGDLGPSSQTFLISLDAPYGVESRPSNDAPPSVKPILLPWSEDTAVMVGGGATNQAIFLYGPDGWANLGVSLTEPIVNQNVVQCTLVSGDDGSKVLEKFDMSKTPNEVSRIALLEAGGKVAPPGKTVGAPKNKRLTISDWPTYNSTYAPEVPRSGFSVAQGSDGLAVISGGSEEDPLCIFDQTSNAWVNATRLFEGEQVVLKSTPSSTIASSTPAPTTSATPTASATQVPVVPAAPTNKNRMLTVLGATLGAIFGIAAILILLLFCLKYRKAKNKKKAQQSGYIEKDRLSFADRGAEFMHEAGGSVGHNYSSSMNVSQTSLAIVSGQSGGQHKRGLGSDASTAGLVMKKSPLGYSEPVELAKFDLKPEQLVVADEKLVRQNSGRVQHSTANISRSRSSGWSKYFANNEATNLAHMPSGRSTYASERTSTGSQSMYTDSRIYNHPSQAIKPLEIPKFDGQRLSKVQTGSPTLGNSRENLPIHQPMQAELGRANSNGSSRSGHTHDDYYARDPVKSWTPVGDDERPPSSNYTNSMVIEPNAGRNNAGDGQSSYYADGTSSFYPKSNYSSFYPGQPMLGLNLPEDRDSTFTMFPGAAGMQDKAQQSQPFYPEPPRFPGQGGPEGRESTVTVFPGGPGGPQEAAPAQNKESFFAERPPPRIPGFGAPEGRESTVTVFPHGGENQDTRGQTDMSWLNLGAGK
ncbi:hypothetical protein BU24DRAFT_106609 [Aaosphaeria arxii CBS 175.79]|uniref:Galactose oxidase n=1 Tax=Aaosphaeria arxii CBS 175.79 TaxID=1450172 RepID=A0A6A5Y1Q7_9PLEO|nr:uncharacterized protein BU24DRAFT_106609 [Aaosphaeria arxii CBS 175.79]KAF2018861.1 hypothetical protein BU24DRAFT_106609 [Aaosphaeria arxii CBS 175.79]